MPENNQTTFYALSAGKTRLLNFSASTSENKKRKACVEEALTSYFDGNNP